MPLRLIIIYFRKKENKISVPVFKRKENKLTCIMKALALCKHTLHIIENKKIFTPDQEDYLTKDIAKSAKNIFIYAWTANNIKVSNIEEAVLRLAKAKEAVSSCIELLAYIEIARVTFKIHERKIYYWIKLATEAKSYLQKWYESEKKRYSYLFENSSLEQITNITNSILDVS